jgi:hypothetical protein
MMSRCATFALSLIKAAILVAPIALAAASALADSGPQQVLYIFPGATDDGGSAGAGRATVVHCFSFSPTSETIQYVVRNWDGSIRANTTFAMSQFHTVTAVTHTTNLYAGDVTFGANIILDQGVIGISATSSNIVCTAQVIDASATVPNGIELHGTRFNPISGSQE